MAAGFGYTVGVQPSEVTLRVKRLSLEGGFQAVGIAPATAIDAAWRQRFEQWLESGHAGEMDYLHRDSIQRYDPRRVLAECRSVIVLATSYAPSPDDPTGDLAVARYARGRDYHKVLKKRAHQLCDRLREAWPEFIGRAFVDTGPVAEKSLAVLAGLGWVGRNGLLIVPGLGSWVLLTEILCNLPLMPDAPHTGNCGPCRACLAACPTSALLGDGLIAAQRCLSYRNKGGRQLPREQWTAMGNRLFGCDACQEVCPHNRDVPPGDPQLRSSEDSPPLMLAEVLNWSEADFDLLTRGRPIRRAGYLPLLRHAVIAGGNTGRQDVQAVLEDLRRRRPELQDVIDWAQQQSRREG